VSGDRRSTTTTAALLAVAAFLPFVRGSLAGASLYFRDLSLQFFPVRRFVAEGLRSGELRYWNPFANEGVPLSLPPLGYPLDLLHVLRPDDAFFSLLLVLHIPLAALALFALARHLGASRTAAAGGGLLFGLGGFALSSVNLYVYAQALPWVALVVLALRRAASGGRREVATAALAGAALLTTTAVEFALQAFAVGLVLAPRTAPRAARGRLATSLALAVGLAAFVLAPASALVAGTARQAGFPTDVVLAHSVHPVALAQTLAAGLFGDPAHLADRFWGVRFFPRGFPYFLSLYVGATGLALAVTGAFERRPAVRRLVALALVGLVLCLGPWAGLTHVVDLLGSLRKVRFPSKAFLTVHLSLSLLAAVGLDALSRADRAALRRFTWTALGLGLVTLAGPSLALATPPVSRFLLAGFFPPELPWPLRFAYARSIAADAAQGGAVALLGATLAALALRQRVRASLAATGLALLLGADLLRAGAGLNPTVAPGFLEPSAPVARLAARLRDEGGRMFPFDPSYSPAYYRARAELAGRHELWSFALLEDTFAPDTNLASAVPTALTPDRTMLVPLDRVLAPEQASPQAFAGIVGRLQAAGVTHVLSLEPIEHPALCDHEVVAVPRLAPLDLHLYRLLGAKPLAEVVADAGAAGRVVSVEWRGDTATLVVDGERSGRLVFREAAAPGWNAGLDGRPAAVERAEGRYLAVAVPSGRHRVVFRYRPPRLVAGVAVSALSLLVVAWLAVGARRRRPPVASA
jgi:Bacterial membrane protein YfhO